MPFLRVKPPKRRKIHDKIFLNLEAQSLAYEQLENLMDRPKSTHLFSRRQHFSRFEN